MAEVTSPRKFKLRRVNPTEEIIQKNLEPLKQNIKKKKIAQQYYYETHNESGLSPLVRDLNKRPVHQRLGRKAPYTLGTNTSAIPPKRRLRLPGKFQQNRTSRVFSAQNRINLIRAKNRESQNVNVSKKIKLRRKLPQHLNGPTNLTVEVKNNNAFINRQLHPGIHRFKQILNIQLQQEIKKIQMDFQGSQIIMPIRVTPAATEIPLNKRFAELN